VCDFITVHATECSSYNNNFIASKLFYIESYRVFTGISGNRGVGDVEVKPHAY
jgi:hypothetical protein